jgi:pimeloyl-ACP methyl ester carboxylesterase
MSNRSSNSRLVIYGDRDPIPRSPNLSKFVPNAEEVGLDSGHWVQQERPEETNRVVLQWLEQQAAGSP